MRQVIHQALAGASLFALVAAPAVAQARPWEAREPSVEPKPAHQLRNPARLARRAGGAGGAARRDEVHARVGRRSAASRPIRRPARWRRRSSPRRPPPRAIRSRSPRWRGTEATATPATAPRRAAPTACSPSSRACTAPPGAPELPVDKADLTSKRLLDPDVNLAVGAALLEMWNASHKELDAAFGGGLHRSGVAHFVWGDVVRSSGQEDLILTARRAHDRKLPGEQGRAPDGPVHRRADRVAAGGGAARGDQRAGRRSFGRRAPACRAGHRGHARRAGARDRGRHRDLRGHQQPQPRRG